MTDITDNDSSSDDVFIIKQIKPVNKLTLQQALIIKHTVLKAFQSKENKKKKKENVKKLNTEEKQNKKGEANLNEEPSKVGKTRKNSTTSYCSYEREISEGSVKKKKQQKLKLIKKDLSTKETQCSPDKFKDESLSESIHTESAESSVKNNKSLDSSKNEGKKNGNPKKRMEQSPENSENRKKFKDCALKVESLDVNKSQEMKPLPDMLVKLEKEESPVNKILKNESSSHTSDLIVTSPDDVKNEIIFEEFPPINERGNKFGQNWNFNEEEGEEIYRDNSELLCFSLKKIISDETKKQIELEQKNDLRGRAMQKLFSDNECDVFEKFFHLEERACKLFVRMLLRKRHWHRVSNITYKDIDEDLEKCFHVLKGANFIDTNIEDEDFVTQLELLNKPEIVKLCRSFNVFCKFHNTARKEVLIRSLLEACKKQKSVLDIIQRKNVTHREDLLKNETQKILGMCIRINKETFRAFHKILILFSFAHYFDDEEKRFSNELHMYIRVYKNIIKFPNYKLSPSVVFENQEDFEEYETSLIILSSFERSVNNKNHNEFLAIVSEVKSNFKNILNNYEYHKRFLGLPSFLKKFSAGSVYARILTRYCQTFKRICNLSDIVETVKLLLHQNLFLQRKRGDWYEILSKALETKRKNDEAAEVIVASLKDPLVSEVQRLALQLRGQGILKKKSHGMTDASRKEILDDLCTVSVQEPASIEIKGKALEGNEFGVKCVYVQDTGYGKKYTSVEERAIFYYKSHGFPKGYHVEGFIIHSIYFLLFFDIIYGLSPKGVFQSPFQQIPLDFNSASFYLNRKDEIDRLLTDMLTWDEEKVENTIKDVYSRNCDTVCIISWIKEFTPELFCEIIRCITMPTLVLIFQRLVQNFRTYRSGFPDLTLWNPETNKIKFVEVKSPNDRLSPAQRIWLNFLRSIGLSSEVCNVKNLSGRNFD